MTGTHTRNPSGTPTGGQFAANQRGEADVDLGLPDASNDPWAAVTEPPAGGSSAQVHAAVTEVNAAYARWAADRRAADVASATVAESWADMNTAIERLRGFSPGTAEAAFEQVDADVAAIQRGERSSAESIYVDDEGRTVHFAESAAVQGGEIVDSVRTTEGTVYRRRRDGVYPDWPYAMRFQANRPLSDDEVQHFAGLVGYTYRSTVAGEPLDTPERDSPYSFTVYADTTKTRRDDVGMALEEFEQQLPDLIQNGSPVRKTDRSGEGTKGTRLVDGFNDPDLKFETYYDSVLS